MSSPPTETEETVVLPLPEWSEAAQRRRHQRDTHPFQPLNSAYRIRQAIDYGAQGFLILALTHVFAMGFVFHALPDATPLLGRDPQFLAAANLAGALMAVLLYLRFRATRSIALAWVMLGWPLLTIAGVSYTLYGHRAHAALLGLAMVAAVLALRGAYRARSAANDPPPTAEPF